jgi:hypothetical protein
MNRTSSFHPPLPVGAKAPAGRLRGTGSPSWFACGFLLGLLILVCALAGCQSGSPAPYVAPRVTGRVLDARTRQPVAHVEVSRVTPGQDIDPGNPPHGGQVMEQAPAVRTGPDGAFVLHSVRDLTPFRRYGWFSVTLNFQHAAYQPLTTNYTLANSTNTASGEPVVNTGDILLQPSAK